ncbi:MAG TPA: hypothetical protein VF519_10955 [Mycobacteriales bacterium]|jgi:hypothetical protein
MKKLSLRTEYLGELSNDDLRAVAGAAGQEVPGTVSDGSCVCVAIADFRIPACDISAGSCVCTIGTK